MFRCGICNQVTKPGEKQYKKPVKTRKKTYSYINKYGKKATSEGTEIVKEINICENCKENLLKEGK